MSFNRVFLFTALIFMGTQSLANVLFEGYAKVMIGGVHAGYYVSRYEFDSTKKQYSSIYFLKINELGGNLTESLKAYCDDKFNPISYQYTSVAGGITKTIDMSFKNGKMSGVITSMGKEEKVDKPLPKAVGNQKLILSTFLGYVMAAEPRGLKLEDKQDKLKLYNYQAIAEEDAMVYPETALIKEIETINGIKAFKIINDFKDIKFTSYVTDRGDVLSTKAPVQGVATELVADPKEAIKLFPINEKNLTLLFGNVPKGDRNILSENNKSVVIDSTSLPAATDNSKNEKIPPVPKSKTKPGKAFGTPPGKGIHVKGN